MSRLTIYSVADKTQFLGISEKPRCLSLATRNGRAGYGSGTGSYFLSAKESPTMPTSELQESTKKHLQLLLRGFHFVENYRPQWLTNPQTGYPLELDFWLPDAEIGIEVQGIQHLEFTPFFHSTLVTWALLRL